MTIGDVSYEEASKLYDQGHFKRAFAKFMTLAQQGDASACMQVAFMYGSGEGVSYDFEKSVEWDLKAIELGNDASIFNLAITYRTKGYAREARKWFEKSVALGDGDAMVELAKMLDVSDLEAAAVVGLLTRAIASELITEGAREEAESLLVEVRGRKPLAR